MKKNANSLRCRLPRSRRAKLPDHHISESAGQVPDELRQMRRDLAFDYGKFDYAIVNGRVILYDTNRTPVMGSLSKEKILPTIRLLAEGIRAYL